ncbi:alpha-glucosidase [uncultured Maritalea sp.]|uniref:beta-galactosidase BglA n=1 Tax=uncultured Maritalea sp. TaxID=757249 RepID=UPI00262BE47B|nr:alpha-glucosidase [uncultured Maritalea sp.]
MSEALAVKNVGTGAAEGLDAQQDWWRGAVIYQIYPRSFQDSNGDGIGDLVGITERLPYIADLGADAIWLSPFFKSPMKDMGYDVSDYCDVDPSFGTLEDFDAMTARAHELGLKVMIDQVLSHTSDQHVWFEQSRKSRDGDMADWYVWADAKPDGTPPTNWQSVFGGPAWSWNPKRRQYYLHNFLPSQPDLNFHCEAVQDALLETVRFWLERGVDGFRLDTVNFYVHDQELRDNPPVTSGGSNDVPDLNPYGFQEHVYDKTRPENIRFLEKFRALLDEYPGASSVGEVGDGDRSLRTMAEYTAGDDRLHMCYSFDMLGPDFSAAHFKKCITKFEDASQEFAQGNSWPCWAFSNHDVNRHMTRWADLANDKQQFAKLAGALLLSLKGSVCIYQGDELGFTEAEVAFEDLTDPYGITFWPEFKGRDGCRTPFAWSSTAQNAGFSTADKTWLPVAPDHQATAVDLQVADDTSVHAQFKRFLTFRKQLPALISGELTFLEWNVEGLAFVRGSGADAVLCVINLSNDAVTYELPANMSATALENHGFEFGFDGKTVSLNGHQAFFAALA